MPEAGRLDLVVEHVLDALEQSAHVRILLGQAPGLTHGFGLRAGGVVAVHGQVDDPLHRRLELLHQLCRGRRIYYILLFPFMIK